MGANFITMEVKGQSERTLNAAIKRRADLDRAYYGTNPYSGTWATVPGVVVVTYPDAPKVWNKNRKLAAYRWLSDRCEKWENAKAIKTTTGYLVGAWVAE